MNVSKDFKDLLLRYYTEVDVNTVLQTMLEPPLETTVRVNGDAQDQIELLRTFIEKVCDITVCMSYTARHDAAHVCA